MPYLWEYSDEELAALPSFSIITEQVDWFCSFLEFVDGITLSGEPDYYYVYESAEVDEFVPESEVLVNNQGIDFAEFKAMFSDLETDYWGTEEDDEGYEDNFWYWDCFDDDED